MNALSSTIHTVASECVDLAMFEWGDVILCRTELWLRWVQLGSVAFHVLLAATVEKTFREAMHASANQIAFHA